MADIQQLPLQTYRGNCHCGAFVYEIEVPEIKSVGECNCSICYKKAYLWLFLEEKNFHVVKGDIKQLTGYRFGRRTVEHKVICFVGDWGMLAGLKAGSFVQPVGQAL